MKQNNTDTYNEINRFHTSTGAIYFINGIISILYYKSCNLDYITTGLNVNVKTIDIPFNYMMISVGEYCIIITILTHYIDIFIEMLYVQIKPLNNHINTRINAYLIMQLWIWIAWTCIESYYVFLNKKTSLLSILNLLGCMYTLYLNLSINI